jgi:hypothetical protein
MFVLRFWSLGRRLLPGQFVKHSVGRPHETGDDTLQINARKTSVSGSQLLPPNPKSTS